MPAPKIKFCGMTRPEDAELAVELGAWAVGMVFHRESKRYCRAADAVEIGALLKRRCEVVGVFHNAPLANVARVAQDCGLTLVQLHGDEGPAYCEEVARRTGCEVIKAARVRSVADVLGLRVFRTDYHLLDAHVPGEPGGTGVSFPWDYATRHEGRAPVILAGGLTPLNVVEAIAAAQPFAVDVASGVESSPGIKDPSLMRDFADAVNSTTSSSRALRDSEAARREAAAQSGSVWRASEQDQDDAARNQVEGSRDREQAAQLRGGAGSDQARAADDHGDATVVEAPEQAA